MKEVKVNFTGGSQKRYVVTFNDAGEPTQIDAVVRRGIDYGSTRRMFWHVRTGKELSELARIVVRRAYNQLEG